MSMNWWLSPITPYYPYYRFRGYQTGCTFAEAFRKAQVYPSAIHKDALLPMPE